jgi:hypothetical protein
VVAAVVVSKAVAAGRVVEIAVADQAVKVVVIEESDLSVRPLNNLSIRQKISSLIHRLNERALLCRNPCQQCWAFYHRSTSFR